MEVQVLILCGSGNTTGNTYRMCQVFGSVMEQNGCPCEIADLSEYDIRDYIGDRPYDDDMDKFLGKMEMTDLLVFATPVRFNGCSSILKRFIDRLNPYWGSDRPHPRFACGLLCGGSPDCEFSHARSEMVSASNTVGMKWVGALCISNTDVSGVDDSVVAKFALDLLGYIENRIWKTSSARMCISAPT